MDQGIAAGALRTEPMALNGKEGRWLYDRTGFGAREACDRALRAAQAAKKAICAGDSQSDLSKATRARSIC